MTRMIFIRHGETLWNQLGKYQGQSDIPLNENGLLQAKKTADRLAEESITAIYTSDLSRAQQTAEFIAEPHNLSVIKAPGLREFNFGHWEGQTYSEIKEKEPELLQLWLEEPDKLHIPGGENFLQFSNRAIQVIDQLLQKHQQETVAVVAHGGVLSVIFCSLLGIELKNIRRVRQNNSGISIIEHFNQRSVLTLFNDTCHL